jgi:hypothetical protein
MERDLRSQGLSTTPPTHESLQERHDSADTAYHSDMYVTSQVVSRWKEIHWWQIDRRCWEATYGPNTQEPAYIPP